MEIFTILHFTGFVFFMKFSFLVCLLWQQSFHRLIMGKIEKQHLLLPSLLKYFDKTFIEMFLKHDKTSIEMFLKQCSTCHMILGLLLILLIVTETKMKKKQQQKNKTKQKKKKKKNT